MVRDTGDALVGRTLGEFVIRERIGEGGFGVVYRAVQAGLEREAVVKVMSGEAARVGTLRFLREAKLASRLDHPYAAHIYAFGAEDDGVLWIAMELVRGTPLDRLLSAQGTIPLERFLPLLERICEVVHTAHEQGIVHRDIKPANVMVLSRAGRYLPKLLDFGIAKALETPGSEAVLPTNPANIGEAPTQGGGDALDEAPSLTRAGAIMGSPLYMAPEQWMDAASVDGRTDLYALGVLAYECLSGKPPFAGTTLNAIAVAHATKPLPPLGEGFPAALDAVLRRAVAKQADERYATAIELATAFREASGLSSEATALPQLDETVRDDAIKSAPHPIAEGVAALEAARNPHQARDALFLLLRTIVRYVGLLAIGCRTRVGSGREAAAPRVTELLRALHRRTLTDEEWLELATELAAPFRDKRDAYPLPELVDVFRDTPIAELLELHTSSETAAPLEVLSIGIPHMTSILRAIAWLSEYTLVVPVAGRLAERWMGVRRSQRATVAVIGRSLPVGEVALLDRQNAPILSLAPLFQVAPSSPGAPLELFLFEGRGRRGAKLSAWPTPFEHHDETLWDWFRAQLTGTLDETEGDSLESRAPYLGLSTFTAADAALFFGREALVDSFVNRLRVNPFLAVVGRSGAGKSSFVQAGVIPALPADWQTLAIRPGPVPLAALAARLEHSGITAGDLTAPDALGDALREHADKRGPMLLVVDQLEELFTLCQDAGERVQFATAIVRAARSADDPVRIVVTLRDDFLVRAEQLDAFRARLGQGLQLVTVPGPDDLLRTLVEPARRVGYDFEDAQLPLEMVAEVADEPSALPLLSFTASKLWELRDRHFKQLTRKAYQSLGGVGGALAQHAEATIEAMPADEQRLVREAFRHLVTSEQTRAVLSRDELLQILGSGSNARGVLEKLIAARLLTLIEGDDGQQRIEIVHEALLATWPRLVRWTREDAEGARLRDQLRAAARQWEERHRSRGLLWRGDALADYERWRKRYTGSLTEVETAFAQASRADAARGKWIRRISIALAFVGLAAAVVLLVRSNARTKAKVAQLYEEQGRQHYLAGDSLRASLYLVAAKQAGASGPAIDFLLGRTLSGLDRKQREIRAHEGPIMALEFDRAGKRMLTASYDGTVRVWDGETGVAVHVLRGHQPLWLDARFNPSGTRIASGGEDGSVRLWDAGGGKLLYEQRDRQKSIVTLEFDREGKRLLVAGRDGAAIVHEVPSGAVLAKVTASATLVDATFDPTGAQIWTLGSDGVLAIFDAATGERIAILDEHAVATAGIAFDPSGKIAVTGAPNALILWDVAQRTRLGTASLGSDHRAIHRVERAEFSRDGKVVAVNTLGGVEVWSVGAAPKRQLALPGRHGEIKDMAFDENNRRIVTAGVGFADIYDLTNGVLDASLETLEQVWVVRFSPRGQLVTASSDGLMTTWNPTGDVVTRRIVKPDRMRVARFSPDGRELATTCADGTLEFWDPATGARLRGREVPDQLYLDWASSGRWLVGAGANGEAYQWDATTMQSMRTFSGHQGEVRGIDVSPDDTRLATADEAGKVRIWDIATGQVLQTISAHAMFPTMVAFDHAGKRVASAGRDRAVKIWSVATGELLETFTTDGWAMSVAFSADDRRLLIAASRAASLWDIATKKQLVTFEGHDREVRVAQLAPNDLVVTGSFDGTARIWDARSGRLLASFARHQNWLRWAEVDHTGTRLATSSDDKSVVVLDIPSDTRGVGVIARIVKERVPFDLRDETVVRRR